MHTLFALCFAVYRTVVFSRQLHVSFHAAFTAVMATIRGFLPDNEDVK